MKMIQRADWHKAPNYLIKIHKCDIKSDGSWWVEDKSKYFSDVQLQFEACYLV